MVFWRSVTYDYCTRMTIDDIKLTMNEMKI